MLSKSCFGKKTIVSLVVKSRNYYQEGIRYVVKVYYKVYPKIFETAYLWIKSGDFRKSSWINVRRNLTDSTSQELFA